MTVYSSSFQLMRLRVPILRRGLGEGRDDLPSLDQYKKCGGRRKNEDGSSNLAWSE